MALVLCCQTAFPLDPSKTLTQYTYDVWVGRSDYPQSTIGSIVQTNDGYLWFGSQTGLVRFDGVTFKTFDSTNTKEITHPAIISLCAARDGSLWFGTFGGGLLHMKDGAFTRYKAKDGLASNAPWSILERRDGSLWIGTEGGISVFERGKFTTYTTDDGLLHNHIFSLAEDRDGVVWVGTQEGLCRYENGRFETYAAEKGMPRCYVKALLSGRDGSLWIGTICRGLMRYKDGVISTYGVKEGLSSDAVLSLCEDREGSLWVGTETGGLNRLSNNRFARFTTREGLASDYVASIFEDREGSLWFGPISGGLNRFKEGSFTTFTTAEGLADNKPETIVEDRTGALWIGTAHGVSRYKNGVFRNFTTEDGLSTNHISSVLEDREGVIWIGTSGWGLCRYDNGKFTSYTTKDGLSSSVIRTLYEDREGVLWIAAEGGGVNYYKDGKFGGYSEADGLSSNSTRDILQDRHGDIWITTADAGVNRLRDGKFTVYNTGNGLSDDTVVAIYEDGEGIIWLGTQAGGLVRFDGENFVVYNGGNGLVNDVLGTILEDDRGNLWLGGEWGIHRASKTELDAYARGEVGRVSHVTFDTTDGMKSSTGRTHSKPAGCKTRDGRLWFPTQKGVTMIDPSQIRHNGLPPPVLIEEMTAGNRRVSVGNAVQFQAGLRDVELKYTGLSFLVPEKVKFKYKLDGFDQDWVEAGTRRVAYYTNLPPGSYTFRVIACNNDGVWNEEGASLSFYLHPHFYQTYWFYLCCALFLAVGAYWLANLRVQTVRRRYSLILSERARISRELHDTVAQEVAGISAQLEAAKAMQEASSQEGSRHLDQARNMAHSCLNNVRRFVRDLRPEPVESGHLMSELAKVAEQLTCDQPVELSLDVKGTPRGLPSEVETNLLRIGREAISNSVKHSGGRHIYVDLEYQLKTVVLCVRDDGRGFSHHVSNIDANHFGIVGMYERARQLGGKLKLQSRVREGTEVRAVVPDGTKFLTSRARNVKNMANFRPDKDLPDDAGRF